MNKNIGPVPSQDPNKRKACRENAQNNITLEDIERDERESSDDCFVATAVYGDRNAYQVRVLRNFRDEVLSNNRLGRLFVDAYYSGLGKKAASIIKRQTPSLIPLIRKGLDLIVEQYSSK